MATVVDIAIDTVVSRYTDSSNTIDLHSIPIGKVISIAQQSKRDSFSAYGSNGDDYCARLNGTHMPRSPAPTCNYRSSRTLLNARPVLLRNGPSSTKYDRGPPGRRSSPLSQRATMSTSYATPSSPFDRRSISNERFNLSTGSLPLTSASYKSSQSIPSSRDRGLPSPHYLDSELDRYVPTYR